MDVYLYGAKHDTPNVIISSGPDLIGIFNEADLLSLKAAVEEGLRLIQPKPVLKTDITFADLIGSDPGDNKPEDVAFYKGAVIDSVQPNDETTLVIVINGWKFSVMKEYVEYIPA